MQPDDFAAAVVTLVKNAQSPLLERLAASESRHAAAEARLAALDGVRDRVVGLEVKSAIVAPPHVVPPVDLSPILARVESMVSRLDALEDIRDRVVSLEVKSDIAPPSVS